MAEGALPLLWLCSALSVHTEAEGEGVKAGGAHQTACCTSSLSSSLVGCRAGRLLP